MKKIICIILTAATVMSLAAFGVSAAEPFRDVKAGKWYHDAVLEAHELGLMNGVSETEFAPTKNLTRAQAVTLLANAVGADVTFKVENKRFTDVPVTSWCAAAVEWASGEGLVNGYSDGSFGPNKNITRQETAAIISRFLDYIGFTPARDTAAREHFTDEKKISSWAAADVELMKTYGIFKGDADGNFNPKSPISRAETATFMVRLIPAYREIADKLAPAGEKITFTFENAGETGGLASTLCSDSAVKAVLSGTEAAEALAPGARKAIDVAATFSLNGASVARTYPVYFVRRTGELPASMPTVDDLGAAYCDEATGLKVSKALPIGDENGVILGDGAVGAHGGHESKVLRTRYGVYVLYVTTIYPKPDGYTNASDVFNLIKITDDGCRVIMTGECPRAWGSCLPEVFAGEDGYIYVSVLANLYEKAWLNMYKIDEKTEKVVSEAPLVTDFKLTSANGHATHGYGYSMPIPDIENGKIYGLYTGGAIPGYQAWFIYDIATGKWDKDCRSIQTEYRLGYFMAYADGEGGFWFFGQRDVYGGEQEGYTSLREYLGVSDIVKRRDGYVFDAVYLYHVPDANEEVFETRTVYEPDYRHIFDMKHLTSPSITQINYTGASYYGLGGCTYRDFDRNLHIIYRRDEDKKVVHAIFDTNGDKIFEDYIEYTDPKFGDYTVGLTQGDDGTFYLLIWHVYRKEEQANLEIRSSSDGREFTVAVPTFKIDSTDGGKPGYETKMIITSPRNYSLMDGTVGILFYNDAKSTDANGNGQVKYYFVEVELP